MIYTINKNFFFLETKILSQERKINLIILLFSRKKEKRERKTYDWSRHGM